MSDTYYRLITCNYSFDTHSNAGFAAFETACHYSWSNSEHNYPRGLDELTLVALVHSALRQSRNLRRCGSSRRLSLTSNNMVFPVWASSSVSFRFMVCESEKITLHYCHRVVRSAAQTGYTSPTRSLKKEKTMEVIDVVLSISIKQNTK